MGKNLKGKEFGLGISQREDGYYVGRYTNKYGRRVQKLFLKLQECRQWLPQSIDIPQRNGELVNLKARRDIERFH